MYSYDQYLNDAKATADKNKGATDSYYDSAQQLADAKAENQYAHTVNGADISYNNAIDYATKQGASDVNYAKQTYDTVTGAYGDIKDAGMDYANKEYMLANKNATMDKNAADAYAQDRYGDYVKVLKQQAAAGKELTEEQKRLLYQYAADQRNTAYKSAKLLREQDYKSADVARERAIVDARSSGAIDRATYGAQAEAMAGMGLAAGGYSDYVNAQAYAQQRAATQQANANAETVKRNARYTENQSKLAADSEYNQSMYKADSEYAQGMYEVDTSYREGMLAAEQDSDQMLYDAEAKLRDDRYNAETNLNRSEYEIDTSYTANMADAKVDFVTGIHEAESTEREAVYRAETEHELALNDANATRDQAEFDNQAAANAGKYNAELTYNEAVSDIQEKLATRDEADMDEKQAVYTTILEGVANGTYSADTAAKLAEEYGLSTDQIKAIGESAATYASDGQAALASEYRDAIANGQANSAAIHESAKNGAITMEEYNKLWSQYNGSLTTNESLFARSTESGTAYCTASEAKDIVRQYLNDPMCSKANKDKIKAAYNKQYAVTVGAYDENGGNQWTMNNWSYDYGSSFQMHFGESTYGLKNGGLTTDPAVEAAATSVRNGTAFLYQGNVYVKNDGQVFVVDPSSSCYKYFKKRLDESGKTIGGM